MASIGSQFAPRVALERTVSAIASARRAVLADRYAINSFAVEWRWLADLLPVADEWRDLAGAALEPNIFYEPGFRARRRVGVRQRRRRRPGVVGDGPRKLLGFFPARMSERRYGLKLRRPGRLDASLWPARNAARRPRCGRAGDRGLARAYRRRSVAARTGAAAAARRGRTVCHGARRDSAAHANAVRRFRATSPRFAGAAPGSLALSGKCALGAPAPRIAPQRTASVRRRRAIVHDGVRAGRGRRQRRRFFRNRSERLERRSRHRGGAS